MYRGLVLSALCAVALATAPAYAQRAPAEPPAAEREARPPDAKFDRSTATEARRKFEAAGWRDVTELRKGYDAVWHALATKDGKRTHVALLPDGQVYPEGD
jgi:hypothetical protein